ncbi:MAG: serine/threonine-protein phosphatase [Actinomycetales bacterium]|nr:MAG: serine/threonine-protein phosphatase [Actinomycetales bacterium]
MSFTFKSYALSDLGLHREGNEDSGLISDNLIAVADGMGGHAGGEIASTIAITALVDARGGEDFLLSITKNIDATILAKSTEQPDLIGMGTTLTALHIAGKTVELLHVGDSRCYAFSGGKLTQLSHDHTVIQELVDQGRVSPEEAINHPQRSLLTQALTGGSEIEPVLQIYPIKLGDQFLLCSDGLTTVLSDFEIAKIAKSYSGEELIKNLIAETHAKGAPDNVTVIWAEVVLDEGANHQSLIGAANG